MALDSVTPHATVCGNCPLKSVNLCRTLLELTSQSGLRAVPRIRTIEAETRLQEEDQRPQVFGVLRKGYLRTERLLNDGRRTVLSFLVPGDQIGDVLGSVRGPAVVAATDIEYCAFDAATLRRALQVDAPLHAQFLAEGIKQFTRQLELVWRRGALSSRERIIAFMVMATEFMPTEKRPDGSIVLTINVSRKDWADFSNSTVETICRTLAYLVERDLVENVAPSRYLIRDLRMLTRFAGLDSRSDWHLLSIGGSSETPGLQPALAGVDPVGGGRE